MSPTTSPPSRSTSRTDGRRGAAGREHVVDDQHLLAGRDRVAVDLEQVGAVLELVLLALDLPRELARPCARARTRPARWYATGAANTKPRASIPSTLSIALGRRTGAASASTDRREGVGCREQRRDVLEDDARLRVVGDVAHVLLERTPCPSRTGYRPDARCGGRFCGVATCACGDAAGAGAARRGRDGRRLRPTAAGPGIRLRRGCASRGAVVVGRVLDDRDAGRRPTPAAIGVRCRRRRGAPGTAARAPSTTRAAARRRRSTSTNR